MKTTMTSLSHAMLGALALILAIPAMAEQAPEERIRTVLGQVLPNSTVDSVEATPITAGLYEAQLDGAIYYLSADGRYLVKGDIIDLQTQTNLTEAKLTGARAAAMADVDEKSMIIYPATGESKHTLTVFTDIDCGYCRKLHGEMKELNALGITVRYLAYPRAGVGSISYQKAVSVWCSDDRNAAMDKAKLGDMPEEKSCDNPVQQQMQLGENVGVTGTPALVLEDGTLVPGYMPAKRMIQMLESKKKGS